MYFVRSMDSLPFSSGALVPPAVPDGRPAARSANVPPRAFQRLGDLNAAASSSSGVRLVYRHLHDSSDLAVLDGACRQVGRGLRTLRRPGYLACRKRQQPRSWASGRGAGLRSGRAAHGFGQFGEEAGPNLALDRADDLVIWPISCADRHPARIAASYLEYQSVPWQRPRPRRYRLLVA